MTTYRITRMDQTKMTETLRSLELSCKIAEQTGTHAVVNVDDLRMLLERYGEAMQAIEVAFEWFFVVPGDARSPAIEMMIGNQMEDWLNDR